MLEDLIAAASVNDANRRVEQISSKEKMSGYDGRLNLPSGFNRLA